MSKIKKYSATESHQLDFDHAKKLEKKIHLIGGASILTMMGSLELLSKAGDKLDSFLREHEIPNPLTFPPSSFAAIAVGASKISEAARNAMLKNIGLTLHAEKAAPKLAQSATATYLREIPVLGAGSLALIRGSEWFLKTTIAIGPSAIFANIADNIAGESFESLFSKEYKAAAREYFHFVAFFVPEIVNWATKGAATEAIASLGLAGLSQSFNAFAGAAFSMGIVGYSFDFLFNLSATGYEVTLNSRSSELRNNNALWKYGIEPITGGLLSPVLCSNTNPFGWTVSILEFIQVKTGLKNRMDTCHAIREDLRQKDAAKLNRYLQSLRQTFKEVLAFGQLKDETWNHFTPACEFAPLIKAGWLDKVVADQVQFKFSALPFSTDDKINLGMLAFAASQIYDRKEESLPLRRFLSMELLSTETIEQLEQNKIPEINFFRTDRFDELLNWLGAENILAERRQRFYAALIEAHIAFYTGHKTNADEQLIELGKSVGYIDDNGPVKNSDYFMALHRYHTQIITNNNSRRLQEFDEFVQKTAGEFKKTNDLALLPELIVIGSFDEIGPDFNFKTPEVLEQLRQNKAFTEALKKIFEKTENLIRTKMVALLAAYKLANKVDPFEKVDSIFADDFKHQIGVHNMQGAVLGEDRHGFAVLALDSDMSLNQNGVGYLHSFDIPSITDPFDEAGNLKDYNTFRQALGMEVEYIIAGLKGLTAHPAKLEKTLKRNRSDAIKLMVEIRKGFGETWLKAYTQSISTGDDAFEIFDKLVEESFDSETASKIVMLGALKQISNEPESEIWEVFQDGIFTTDGKIASKELLAYWAMDGLTTKQVGAEIIRLKKIIRDSKKLLEYFTMTGIPLEDNYAGMPLHADLTLKKLNLKLQLGMLIRKYCTLLPNKSSLLIDGKETGFGFFGKNLDYLGETELSGAIEQLARKNLNGLCGKQVYTLDDLEIFTLEERLKELSPDEPDIDKELALMLPNGSDREKIEYVYKKIRQLQQFSDWTDELLKIVADLESRYSEKYSVTANGVWVSIIRQRIDTAKKIIDALEHPDICPVPHP